MVEKRPDPPKAIGTQTLQKQYEELCHLRADLARLEAIAAKANRPLKKGKSTGEGRLNVGTR
jgi:predicted nucleotide-binding protein (sugar kinase/HSP70/actin superfamily)